MDSYTSLVLLRSIREIRKRPLSLMLGSGVVLRHGGLEIRLA